MGNTTSAENYEDNNQCPLNIPDTIPILNLGDRQGATLYIDFINTDEVTSPIMTGVDKFNRRFVVVKAKIEGHDDEFMQTFFQRYTNEHLWISDFRNNFLETYGGMTIEQLDLLQDLIDGKDVILQEYHRPLHVIVDNDSISNSSDYFIGEKVILSGLKTIPLNDVDDVDDVDDAYNADNSNVADDSNATESAVTENVSAEK